MKETRGDLWAYHPKVPIVIPVSAGLNRRGEALLQRGLPRQARDRYPDLPQILGARIAQNGSQVEPLPYNLIALPVEIHPFEVARPGLIEHSLAQLVALTQRRQWPQVALPRLGCGGGMLSWDEVKPLLARTLDDRFLLVEPVSMVNA